MRNAISSESFACFEAGGETFLCVIVTSDETWGHHFELERKKTGMAPSSISLEEKIHKVSVSGEGHGHCLMGW